MSSRISIPTYSAILQDKRYANLAVLLKELNQQFKPNPAQAELGSALFVHGKRRIGAEWGRKAGKSEVAVDLATRLGNMISKGQGYYFAAEATAVREIIWESRRLQDWCPKKWIAEINETEMRITYSSGTFVKCGGADNFRGGKGFNPDFVILDEAADYADQFWHAMRPNFAAKDCIVIVISSPPWELESEPGKPVYFIRLMDLWAKYEQQGIKEGIQNPYFYRRYPTAVNEANLPKGFLEQEKQELYDLGCEDIWEREYEAKRVVAGGKRIVGTYNSKTHQVKHDWLLKYKIERDLQILQWIEVVDPSQTLFGCLWMAINPYSKEVFFLDEIAERDANETTEHILWPRIKEKENELYPNSDDDERFARVCDEAAAWWIVGCLNDPEIGVAFNATQKATNSIEFGVSLLRSLFRYNLGFVSDRCVWFSHQLENWRRDSHGRIPEKGKDLIDCARYGMHEAGYFLSREEIPQIAPKHPRQQRAEQLEDTPMAYAEKEMYRDFMDADGLGEWVGFPSALGDDE